MSLLFDVCVVKPGQYRTQAAVLVHATRGPRPALTLTAPFWRHKYPDDGYDPFAHVMRHFASGDAEHLLVVERHWTRSNRVTVARSALPSTAAGRRDAPVATALHTTERTLDRDALRMDVASVRDAVLWCPNGTSGRGLCDSAEVLLLLSGTYSNPPRPQITGLPLFAGPHPVNMCSLLRTEVQPVTCQPMLTDPAPQPQQVRAIPQLAVAGPTLYATLEVEGCAAIAAVDLTWWLENGTRALLKQEPLWEKGAVRAVALHPPHLSVVLGAPGAASRLLQLHDAARGAGAFRCYAQRTLQTSTGAAVAVTGMQVAPGLHQVYVVISDTGDSRALVGVSLLLFSVAVITLSLADSAGGTRITVRGRAFPADAVCAFVEVPTGWLEEVVPRTLYRAPAKWSPEELHCDTAPVRSELAMQLEVARPAPSPLMTRNRRPLGRPNAPPVFELRPPFGYHSAAQVVTVHGIRFIT